MTAGLWKVKREETPHLAQREQGVFSFNGVPTFRGAFRKEHRHVTSAGNRLQTGEAKEIKAAFHI